MKKISIILFFLLITGCASQEVRDDSRKNIQDHYIEVRNLEDGSYFIEYAGAPNKTLEEARSTWHAKANETCQGENYDYNLWKDSMWQGNLKPERSIFKSGGSAGATGAACATGAAISCMLASILQSGSNNNDKDTRFPVVEGKLTCKKN